MGLSASSQATRKNLLEGGGRFTYSSNGGGIALHYDYDSLNRLANVREGSPTASPLASYGYNANGSLQKVAYSNGLRQEYRYDTLNRLRYLDTLNAVDALVLGLEYQLKPSGHRHALLESSGRRTDWQYDAHYRLTQETISGDTAGPNGSVAYTYDAVGNRQTRTSTLGLLSNQSLSYNANDWLATDTYDSSGNTTASEGNADTYDFLNRLIRRITPTHALLDYEYNAEGILIAKTKNNNREEYHIDGNNPTGYAQVVETFFDTGTALQLQAVHHYGHDLVSVYQNNGSTWQRHFYLYDGLGSVRALANEIGTVTDTYTYDAFGTLLHTAGSTTNPYRYTGERYDSDLGMYYLRARYMNTETGRFWTMDSYEGNRHDPVSLHKYLYANANPVSYVDPSGMMGISELAITASVGGMISGTYSGIIAFHTHGGSGKAILKAFIAGAASGAIQAVLLRLNVPATYAGGVAGLISGVVDELFNYIETKKFNVERVISSALLGAATAGFLDKLPVSRPASNISELTLKIEYIILKLEKESIAVATTVVIEVGQAIYDFTYSNENKK